MENERKDKKILIVNSAINLFYERGYIDTKVEDITKDAGVAKGTFYTYFKSKDDLIYNIVKNSMLKYEKTFNNVNDNKKEFTELIRETIKIKIKFAIENEKIFIILVGALFNSTNVSVAMRDLLIEKNKNIAKRIGDIVKRGIEEKHVNFKFKGKEVEVANMINSLVNVHMGKLFIDEEIMINEKNGKKLSQLEFKSKEINDIEKETDFVMDFILNGIL